MQKVLQLLESSCYEGSLTDSKENSYDDDDDAGIAAPGVDDDFWQDISYGDTEELPVDSTFMWLSTQ